MDDNSYRDALRLQRELQEQLKLVRERLRIVEEYIRLYETLRRGREGEAAHPATFPPADEERPRRLRSAIPPARIADLAEEVLLATGRPMTRGQLVRALEDQGIPLIGKNKAKNLGTILWRFPDRFVNIPGRGYWPKHAPLRD